MNSKESKIFIITLTITFVVFLSMLITGLILIVPNQKISTVSIVLVSVGGGLLFVTIFFLALASLSSNYMKRKEQKNNQ